MGLLAAAAPRRRTTIRSAGARTSPCVSFRADDRRAGGFGNTEFGDPGSVELTLVLAWLALPVVLGAVTLGCGLLLERVAGVRLPFALLPPAGLATAVVTMSLAVMLDATAELAVPLVVALAVAGLAASGLRWLRERFDGWAAAVAGATYLVFGAPVLAAGEPTFAGYVKLDDTATSLGMLDWSLEHGTRVTGLAPSTYEAMLTLWLGDGYPVGGVLPLGLTRLVGIDPAWTWQPYLSSLGALLAIGLYELAGEVVRSQWLRALLAVTAASSALLYGYALWGGVKELFAAALLVLLAGTLPLLWRSSARAAVVPAVAGAAFLDGLSAAGAIWLAPIAVAAAFAAWRRNGWTQLGVGAIVGTLLAAPSLAAGPAFFDNAAEVARGTDDLGNLLGPLRLWQLVGVWPSSDFRVDPGDMRATAVLVAIALAACIVGAVVAFRHRAWPLLLLLGTALTGAVTFVVSSGPWIEGKALAVASPAILLLALVAGAALVERGRGLEGALVLIALAGGVAWSDGLASTDTRPAPYGQLAELESIGKRFAGDGPALMTDYQPYGVRHFLRRLDPESASELRRRLVPLADGRILAKGETAPIDAFAPDTVRVYRTLVLLRATGGLPPTPFRLVRRGTYYDVWQRP